MLTLLDTGALLVALGLVMAAAGLLIHRSIVPRIVLRRWARPDGELYDAPIDNDQIEPCPCCIGDLHDHTICQHPCCEEWE